MRTYTKKLATGVAVAICLQALSFAHGRQEKTELQRRRIQHAMGQLDDVEYLVNQKKFTEAKAVAHTIIEEINAAGGNPRAGHIALGKVLLFEGRKDEAATELGWGWKPGKNESQDLLFPIAASYSDSEYRRGLAYSSLVSYLMSHKKEVKERAGDLQFDYNDKSPGHVAGTAAFLYAAGPHIKAEEAMKFVHEAEGFLPSNPVVAYVKGAIEMRLNHSEEAKRDMKFAASNGKGDVVEKAKAALAKLTQKGLS